ncbi:MAG: OmpA family protein [Lachnospiraceae bacterium]|nr:OmpA family protein [Lachnospiraceae bacterium]
MKKKLFGLLFAAMILTIPGTAYASDAETADASTEVQFGTNQNDAVLVPLDTKIYGTISSGYYWCSFTTGSNAEADYQITTIDKTAWTNNYVKIVIFDEYGTELASGKADSSGRASTFSCGDLAANTTYYVRLSLNYNEELDFVLIVRDLNENKTGIATSDNITGSDEDDTIVIATNQDDADTVSIGSKIETSTTGGYQYYAFVPEVTGEYLITMIDETASSNNYVKAAIYDEYGTEIFSGGKADSSGTASTFSCGELKAGTIFYLCITLNYNEEINYTFTIREPEGAVEETASIVIVEETEAETEELIFTVPFEINSTQVQFVVNEATFIDEEAAKTAVEPVAEALLSHPDNAVLIAGTTATDGTQESCIDLSNRRAEAVKNLLVNEFGVPESQIQTIGLGYEADPFERGQDREIEGDITSAFIESEAKKNRRVVIMDLASDIAQQILADNS